jgi:nitrite reductase/ring-hydroxylating ferredoxin subunit
MAAPGSRLTSSGNISQGKLESMPNEVEVGPASELTPGTVKGAGRYAVGNADGELFAVTRRCRHLYADLANGSIDEAGCLVCPWHGSKYDVRTGRMVLGPQGIFAKIPGLGTAFKALTLVLPLGRGRVVERDDTLYVE